MPLKVLECVTLLVPGKFHRRKLGFQPPHKVEYDRMVENGDVKRQHLPGDSIRDLFIPLAERSLHLWTGLLIIPKGSERIGRYKILVFLPKKTWVCYYPTTTHTSYT